MRNTLPPDLKSGTILGAAKNIVKQLLNTLSAQDYVNIIVYDSTRADQSSPNTNSLVQDHNGTESTELDSLRIELDKQIVEGQNRQSSLSAAILMVLPNSASNSQAAKVIVGRVFASLGNATLPTTELSTSKVKLFLLFKLKQPNDNDIVLTNNTSTQQLGGNVISASNPGIIDYSIHGIVLVDDVNKLAIRWL